MRRLLCLFDKSGIMGKDWADAGHHVTCIDWDVEAGHRDGIDFIRMDLRNHDRLFEILDCLPPSIVVSFPDCTHLAVAGAAHFERKRVANPKFQEEAIELFRTGEVVAKRYDIPSFTENPVSVAASMYRKPDCYFHPYEYGGYLPENDVHPAWPQYIAPRDAYPKKTGAWLLNGFVMPEPRPVPVREGYSDQYLKLGGKSQRTKDIRSMTPRGFAKAVFVANKEQPINTQEDV